MDRLSIPFPTGRTTVEQQSAEQGVIREQETVTSVPVVPGRLLRLTLRSHSGMRVEVEAFASDTVLDLKLILYGKTGLTVDSMALFYGGHRLQDENVLDESGITDGCEILMIACIRAGAATAMAESVEEDASIKLSIKIRRGKCVVVKASPNESIRSVKRSIEEATGLPVGQQTLRFNDEYLSDDKTLSFYQLRHRYALHLETERKPPTEEAFRH